MVAEVLDRRIFERFATLLDYPCAGLAGAAEACAAGAIASPEAAALLRAFAAFAARTPLARLEELYTAAFELDAVHHPYVGYHLFGESYKRSAFLLALKERYRQCGLDAGPELSDHLAPMLRFLARVDDPAEAQELIGQALQPALRRMLKEPDEPPDPGLARPAAAGDEYCQVLRALRLVLQVIVPESEMAPEAASGELLPLAED